MCGRYNLITDTRALIDFFDLTRAVEVQPRYNIAPSQEIPAVRQTGNGRELTLLHWGLIPHWAKDRKFGYRTINARAETVDSKPAFRSAFRYRRCLIPANGFYEWRQTKHGKQPYNIGPKDGGLMAFAGLWEHWTNENGDALESCTIIVGEATPELAKIHDRMPVILPPEHFTSWLDPGLRDTAQLKSLLDTRHVPPLESYPVSSRVNSPRNDDPECLHPIATD